MAYLGKQVRCSHCERYFTAKTGHQFVETVPLPPALPKVPASADLPPDPDDTARHVAKLAWLRWFKNAVPVRTNPRSVAWDVCKGILLAALVLAILMIGGCYLLAYGCASAGRDAARQEKAKEKDWSLAEFDFSGLPSLPSDEVRVGPIPAKGLFGGILLSRPLEVVIDEEVPALYWDSTLVVVRYDELEKLVAHLIKFCSWRKRVVEERVDLDKEIGKFAPSAMAWNFEIGDKRLTIAVEEVTCRFATGDDGTCYFVMDFPEVSDRENQFIKHRPDSLILDYAGVQELLRALSRENLNRVIADARKKEAIQSEFK